MNRAQRRWIALTLWVSAGALHWNVGDWNPVPPPTNAGEANNSGWPWTYDPEPCIRGFAREYESVIKRSDRETRTTQTNDGHVYLALLLLGVIAPIGLIGAAFTVLAGGPRDDKHLPPPASQPAPAAPILPTPTPTPSPPEATGSRGAYAIVVIVVVVIVGVLIRVASEK